MKVFEEAADCGGAPGYHIARRWRCEAHRGDELRHLGAARRERRGDEIRPLVRRGF